VIGQLVICLLKDERMLQQGSRGFKVCGQNPVDYHTAGDADQNLRQALRVTGSFVECLFTIRE